jgi:hypothetical protein
MAQKIQLRDGNEDTGSESGLLITKFLNSLLKVFLKEKVLSSGASKSFHDFENAIRGRRSVAERREIGMKKSSSLRRAGPSSLFFPIR